MVSDNFGRIGGYFDDSRNDYCGTALGRDSTASPGFGLLRLADAGDSVVWQCLDLVSDHQSADTSPDQATSGLRLFDPALGRKGVAKRETCGISLERS